MRCFSPHLLGFIPFSSFSWLAVSSLSAFKHLLMLYSFICSAVITLYMLYIIITKELTLCSLVHSRHSILVGLCDLHIVPVIWVDLTHSSLFASFCSFLAILCCVSFCVPLKFDVLYIGLFLRKLIWSVPVVIAGLSTDQVHDFGTKESNLHISLT